MITKPAALILVNDEIVSSVQDMIERQLFIDETIDGYTFDERVLADPSYNITIKKNTQRILVLRDLHELDNRTLFDVVCYCKNGLISILDSKFGPPGETYPVVNLTWAKLLVYKTW
jgi:hypothetical protein